MVADLALRAGDVVEVLSAPEILTTLDRDGCLDSLPFMPEMLRHCGRRFVVSKRADKVCDTIHYTGSRKVPATVFLEDLRCEGSSHGGCQAECRLYFKEAWLRRVSPEEAKTPPHPEPTAPAVTARLAAATAAAPAPGATAPATYRCQATELLRSSELLRTFDLRPYVREVLNGDVTIGRFVRVMAKAAWMQPLERLGLLPKIHLTGSRNSSAVPEPSLGLQPGEWVRVKTRAQIRATLNAKGRNRGLWFDREMMPYCGKVFRVRQRVARIVDEASGRMIEMKHDCVTLEGVVCSGGASTGRWLCTRGIFPYWRECWLERVEAPARPTTGAAETPG